MLFLKSKHLAVLDLEHFLCFTEIEDKVKIEVKSSWLQKENSNYSQIF